jgi:hypothetical protein
LAELGDALHARRFAVLRAYADESDQPRVGIYTVAGFVFSEGRARHFCKLWKSTLDSAGLDRFHMKDCMAGRKEYKDWTEEFRNDFLSRLVRIIRATALVGVSVSIDLESYNSLSAEEKEVISSKPYAIGLESFLGHVVVHFGKKEPIAYIFDDGDTTKAKTRILVDWDFMKKRRNEDDRLWLGESTIGWGDSSQIPELQAADMLTWTSAKGYAGHIGRLKYPMSPVLRLLIDGTWTPPIYHGMFDLKGALPKKCDLPK